MATVCSTKSLMILPGAQRSGLKRLLPKEEWVSAEERCAASANETVGSKHFCLTVCIAVFN